MAFGEGLLHAFNWLVGWFGYLVGWLG